MTTLEIPTGENESDDAETLPRVGNSGLEDPKLSYYNKDYYC